MALIGTMKYLTIGNNTYEIDGGDLPIASASTLGGIKVGSGLTIDSTTGVLNATGTSITIDNEMSDSSTNPVQNKVIKEYVDDSVGGIVVPTKTSDLTNDSGFTSNTGTVTSVRVQATSPVQSSTSTEQTTSLNTTISLADGYGDTKNPYASKTKNYVLAAPSNAAGAPSFRALVAADIPDLSSTYLTSHQSIKTLHSKTLTGTGDVTLSYSDVGAAASSHAHGNITNGGDITATAPTIANGDQIIINDNSVSKITNGPTFDGSTTTKALTPKGTWETFLQSFTESDPVFSASAAAGITSSDISSWNAKVSDDHKWNDVSLTHGLNVGSDNDSYVPIMGTVDGTTANFNTVTKTPQNYAIAKYGTGAYLYSTTPSANDNSTKVATTAYVDSAISGAGGGTVTSVGLTNATNGGLTISGSPVTSSGSITVGHSNVLASAQTTSGIYPIKIDKNGHISEYGSAVTVPTITLNGSSTTSPSFYAPTSGGTSGYVLQSNGNNAPSWVTAVLTDQRLYTSATSANTTYYGIFDDSSATGISTKFYDTKVQYSYTAGTSESVGKAIISLGNDNNLLPYSIKGQIKLYAQSGSVTIDPGTSQNGAVITLPNTTGTIALTSDVPTKTSDLTNDSGFITGYTETDPTVPSWAKAANPPTEIFVAVHGTTTSAEIEAAYQAGKEVICQYNNRVYRLVNRSSATLHNFEATSVDIFNGNKIYQISCNNDSWTVPVPWTSVSTSRTINSKALSSNITLTATDVGALPDTTPYIVDEGSVTASPTGAFNYYRKWSNGKAEFWYSYYSSSGLTTATWSSPLAYKDVTTFSNIWDGVFTTINIVNVLTRDSQAISIYPLSWTTSGVSTMRFVTVGTKSNNAYGISLYAFGTWE